jgi:hypothetical protein
MCIYVASSISTAGKVASVFSVDDILALAAEMITLACQYLSGKHIRS